MLLFSPVKSVSLKHGWFYHYRLHSGRLSDLASTGFSPLRDYLEFTFRYCPEKPFIEGGRASSLKIPLQAKLEERHGTLCGLAAEGLVKNKDAFSQNHSRVEAQFIENDPTTIACEVPLWVLKNEADGMPLPDSTFPFSGHIDVLRLDGNRVNILDYKPNAHREKYAATQLYFYSLMLSRRTGIPLEKMSCAYFDENREYWFEPKDCTLG